MVEEKKNKPYSFVQNAPKFVYNREVRIMILATIVMILFMQMNQHILDSASDSSHTPIVLALTAVFGAIWWYLAYSIREDKDDELKTHILNWLFPILIFEVVGLTYMKVAGGHAPAMISLSSPLFPMTAFAYSSLYISRWHRDHMMAFAMEKTSNKWYCFYSKHVQSDQSRRLIAWIYLVTVLFSASFCVSELFERIVELPYGIIICAVIGIIFQAFMPVIYFLWEILEVPNNKNIAFGRVLPDGTRIYTDEEKYVLRLLGIKSISFEENGEKVVLVDVEEKTEEGQNDEKTS